MNKQIREKILQVCEHKIQQKGDNVQLSFYAFFANRNDAPAQLMGVARWWIEENKLNHFEKATKIYAMVNIMTDSDTGHDTPRKGLNHLTLSVSDVAKSMAFYRDLLGFKPHVIWARGAYLSYGDCWLCLSLGNAQPSQDYSHFAFSYDTSAIQTICKNPAYQSVIEWQKNSSEGDSLYLSDPDGHKLELHSGGLASRLASLKQHPYDGLEWLE